ncbi:MAG TPA: sulfotransferase, partial [Sphingomicrobium sp.]|nr:sulfotransferase [Sphingomicrobium sp.]
YSKMNEIFLEDQTNPEGRAAVYRDMIRQGRDIINEEWVGSWRSEADPDPRPAPVFLVGFPRSGTTLLDTILMGHPQIEVLEEEPALGEANQALSSFDGLPTIPDDEIQRARDAYYVKAGELTPLVPGNLLVDKNPLTMNLLPIVRRVFPDARIILALRHPCDVVLSCFVSNFRLNDGMSNFIRLDTAAELYDLSFSYFEQVQKLMPMPTHVVRYESIVEDRTSELQGLFEFLGLDWHDAVLDHQTTALNRGRIKTASYAQVVEPIYKRSAGRWQHFRKHLEPILPVLAPWAAKFGYTI